MASGPLHGFRVLEMSGLGPGPYAGLLLSDLGADVVCIDRSDARAAPHPEREIVRRGRRSVAVDLKHDDGAGLILDLVERADALIEPFRPGVAERLGIGPDACMARNPRLVYARVTGWGQSGPLAHHAGHDINYVALAGALEHIGRAGQPPVPPLNLVGDMGAGGLLAAFGIVAALLEAQRSGQGQVVDAAIVDGVASLMAMIYAFDAQGFMTPERGTNAFDGGAPYYDVYRCADGRYVSVGPIEGKFYAQLLRALGLGDEDLPPRRARENWPVLRDRVAAVFATKTRDEWAAELDAQTEICFAPVLSLHEAPQHPHLRERKTFVDVAGIVQPAPVPRFSRTPGAVQAPPTAAGLHADEVLAEWLGADTARVDDLRSAGVVGGQA